MLPRLPNFSVNKLHVPLNVIGLYSSTPQLKTELSRRFKDQLIGLYWKHKSS